VPGSQRPFSIRLLLWAGAGLASLMTVFRLFRPGGRPQPSALASPSCSGMLAELTGQSQKIAAHAIRLQIGAVVTQARTLLNYLQAQPEGAGPWQEYVRNCLASALTGTRQFVDRSPYRTDPTDPAVIKFSAFLSTLAEALGSAYGVLTGPDTADAHNYQTRLDDINQAYFDTVKSP
jgi:hypothetical protein